MRIHVIRHAAFEGPGLIAEWAKAGGHSLGESSALTEEYPRFDEVDLVVVLGGPMAADDHEANPWLAAEKRYLNRAVSQGVHVLGVCLGAQILAEVAGGRVRRNVSPEIGWFPVRVTESATTGPVFSGFPDGLVVGHWHSDTFDLPPGAQPALSSEATPNQAFSLAGGRLVGLQFHLEWTAELLGRLIAECGDDLASGGRYVVSAAEMAAQAEQHVSACREALVCHTGLPREAHKGVVMAGIVEVVGLVKRFGELTAVDGVSFEIAQGEIFGLLGPNGAGKTTAISMISCLLAPDEGDVRVAGHSVLSDSIGVRRELGVVPQEIALYPTLTATENLRFWGRMYGMSGKTLEDAVSYGLSMAGLEDKAKVRVETFSGGMKRRINIAAGILHRPRVLLMDEPTVGIDPQSRNHILDTVRELNREGMTVVYTSHYMEEVEALCDRIAIIDHGKVIARGTLEELRALVGDEDRIRIQIGDDLAVSTTEGETEPRRRGDRADSCAC